MKEDHCGMHLFWIFSWVEENCGKSLERRFIVSGGGEMERASSQQR
jgi:hypothetical protein